MEPSPLTAPTRQSTTRAVDRDANCARINYTGYREMSAQTLKALHFPHVHNVPFENLDIHLGNPLSLNENLRNLLGQRSPTALPFYC